MFSYFKNLPTYMDYDGQRKAEKIFQTIVILFAIVGLGWGYTIQQFSQTVYILAAGFFLSCVLTLPPWPMYRRKPLPWVKAGKESHAIHSGAKEETSSPTPKGKKKANKA